MPEKTLEARVAALEAECKRLGDIEAIKRVRHKYCRSVNQGRWSELDECFAEDSTIDFGPGRQFKGREAVGKFYSDMLSKGMIMTVVYTHNPEIDVTGDTAKGLWEFDNFRVESSNNEGSRTGGAYEEEYVRVNGKWKIRSTRVRFHFRQPGAWHRMEL